MVSDEMYAEVIAENQRLREQVADLSAQLAAAVRRIAEQDERIARLAAKKTPPPHSSRPTRQRVPRASGSSGRPSTTEGGGARSRRRS